MNKNKLRINLLLFLPNELCTTHIEIERLFWNSKEVNDRIFGRYEPNSGVLYVNLGGIFRNAKNKGFGNCFEWLNSHVELVLVHETIHHIFSKRKDFLKQLYNNSTNEGREKYIDKLAVETTVLHGISGIESGGIV